jgi:response regulator RpfG family c-di-GMP phosphodiesterase
MKEVKKKSLNAEETGVNGTSAHDPLHIETTSPLGADERLILFAEEERIPEVNVSNGAWKLLIVDDEEEVHKLTRLVLDGYTFENRPLRFFSCYSAAEAKEFIRSHPDTAIILLDVVMETADAGLSLIKFIREDIRNRFVRIILRTGQPGQAPEHQVVVNYDINDYKAKIELTSQKLYTTITASLRAFRDICSIERNRKGLERIISASSSLFELQALKQFARGVLAQLISILHLDEDPNRVETAGFVASRTHAALDFTVLTACGYFEGYEDRKLRDVAPPEIRKEIENVVRQRSSMYYQDHFLSFFETKNGIENVIYLRKETSLTALDRNLIRIFVNNAAIAVDNIHLNREIVATQKEVIYTLGEVVENRSKETANHVRRVAELCDLMGSRLGMPREEIELLRLASPMHDVGKIGIPDLILNKPASLTPGEFEIIKKHTVIGYDILKNSNRRIMQAAATVAFQHHERWDGSGYPCGLGGDGIHVYGRITGLADVVDALSHRRVYKEAWKLDRVVEYVRKNREILFDPDLVDIFLSNLERYVEILERFPDENPD